MKKDNTALYLVLAIVSIIVITLLIFRKDLKSILAGDVDPPPRQSQAEAEANVESILGSTTPNDDSSLTEQEELDYSGTAEAIATSMYNELIQFNIDEYGMAAMLANLDGAQLRAVYDAFGAREWNPFFGQSTYLDLFQFYGERLDNSVLYGNEMYLDWEGLPDSYIPNRGMPICDGLVIGCTEKEAFRAIWWRSGLPLTF